MTLTETRPAPLDFAAARRAMIDSQLRTSGVNDPRVLERMAAVAREDHVPEALRTVAYVDRALALGDGRRIAAPLFYGMVLAEAQVRADDRVLVVDGGSGYLAALAAPLAATVDVLDPAGALGKGKGSAYSLVLVDGAIEHVPATLARRMAEGGRIVTGLVERGVTRLATGRKAATGVALLPLAELGIPRLAEFDRPVGWSF